MEQVVFIHTIDCRVCAKELDQSGKQSLKIIIEARRKCAKCKGCQRLKQYADKQ